MADEVKTIRIVVDASRAVDGGRAAQKALEDIERNTGTLGKAVAGLESMFTRLFAGYLGLQGVRMLSQTADEFTKLTNALKVTGLEAEQLRIIQDRLFISANRHGVEIGALGQLFNRLSISQKELGASYEQMLKFVDGVTASLRIQGGSTEAAQGALLQLSQAMGSGIVRAEEFNSILEGALPIAQAAARGIDGMEGSVSKLRAAVVEGRVTSKAFFDGLMKGFGDNEKLAESMGLTTQAAFTILRNGFTHLIGSLTEASGGGGILAKAIASVGREMDSLAQRPDVMRSVKETFQAITAAIGEAIGKLQEFAGWMSGIINQAGQFAREQSIADIRDRRLPEYDRYISDQKTAVLKAERALQIQGMQDRQGLSGDSGQRYFAAQQEYFKQQEKLAQYEAGRREWQERLAREEFGPTLNALRGNAGPQARGVPRSVTLLPGGGGGGGGGGAAGGGKAAENAADKYAEYMQQLNLTAEAQNRMTEAARGGDVAFQEQKATLDAQQKMLDIYGLKLGYTKEQLTAVRDKLLEIAQGKAAEAFNVATTALEQQNVLLEAQIRLRNELPETQAREIALIKSRQEAEKAGSALSAQDVENRRAAIEVNERLKTQAEELKKAQELWTEPLKQALRDIQSIGADAFDKLLESGKFSFEELGQTFMRIVRRMAAEFLALATIRPVMSVMVNAVSPAMAQSMGLGSAFPGLGGGTSGSSGGGLSLGGLGGGGFLSSIGGWLNSPISFGGALNTSAASPASMMAPTGATGAMFGGTTWLQGIGALAGAGMGAYQLLSGNGSTSSTIGGISSILGAGVSLIPGIGQIAGPAIALLGNLLPGLLGLDKPPTITNQEYGDLTYGSNGFFTSGGAWGPNANASNAQGALGGMGTTMQGIFNALGGVKDPSKVWGVALQNFSQQYGDKSSFSNQTSFLAGPNGERIQWGQGSTTADVGLEAAGLAAALKSIMGGAVGEISANLEKGLGTLNLDGKGTLAQLAAVVAEIKTFDDAIAGLGKTVTSAEQAILQIDQSFAAMYATAEKYGLPVGDVDAAKAKARLGVATDFGKSISRGILELTDPKAAALADLDDWRATMVDNNKWLLENVTGALDHINEIERLYGLKRAAIVEQGASQALSGLVDVIKRLTYGDLSGASPAATLSGLTGSFNAMLAQANAGDQTAIAGIGAAGAELAEFGKSYYGSATPAFQNLVSGIRGNLAGVYTAQGGTDPLIVALTTVSAQFAAAGQDNAELKADMAEVTAAVTVLTEKLQRMLDKMAA